MKPIAKRHPTQQAKALREAVRAIGLQSGAKRAFLAHPNAEAAPIGPVQFYTERLADADRICAAVFRGALGSR